MKCGIDTGAWDVIGVIEYYLLFSMTWNDVLLYHMKDLFFFCSAVPSMTTIIDF